MTDKSGAITRVETTAVTKTISMRESAAVAVGIADDDAAFVRDAATRIKVRLEVFQQNIIEIGRDLIAAKERISHGGFLSWIRTEFHLSEDSAGRFMNVARNMADKIPHGAEFSPSVLYELAAPSTPDEVHAVIGSKAAKGETVSLADVKRLKKEVAAQQEANAALTRRIAASDNLIEKLEESLEVTRANTVTKDMVIEEALLLRSQVAAYVGAISVINEIVNVGSYHAFWSETDASVKQATKSSIDRAISRLTSLRRAADAASDIAITDRTPKALPPPADDLDIPTFLRRTKNEAVAPT